MRCEVLECEPPSRLVFSWSAGGPVVNTRVSFRLEPDGEGTRVSLRAFGLRYDSHPGAIRRSKEPNSAGRGCSGSFRPLSRAWQRTANRSLRPFNLHQKISNPNSMKPGTKRWILRSIHLILSIPILGYIYGEPAEVQGYAVAVRFVFVPVIILSGFWMFSGVLFAIIGVAVWLGVYYLAGVGAAILSQVALFIARKTWLVIRARRSKVTGSAT